MPLKRKQQRRALATASRLRDAPYRGLFFSWQYECGEKGDGERGQENHQIHKPAKKELKNGEEPALAINVSDRQENLRYKRDP